LGKERDTFFFGTYSSEKIEKREILKEKKSKKIVGVGVGAGAAWTVPAVCLPHTTYVVWCGAG